MIILPAIDILDQKPVRLYQGDYAKQECVGESILEIAKTFEAEGADYLHMVDLDGAKEGKKVNQACIVEVAKKLSIPVEVGGGIRSMEDVDFYIEQGIARVILGTAAIEDQSFLKAAIEKYGDKIAVGIDCKDGYAYGRGWLASSEKEYVSFAKELEAMGVSTIIVTDISKDGTMMGPNVEMLRNLKQEISMNIVASGGIKDIHHIKLLKQLDIYGAITGKAMYAKTLSLPEAIQTCRED
ncbi:1-(5-phosphoribosyl)-5-[(5-phosphoribosylamino)methylideneamino]imidazole-4-carboxamide isomerase [Amedibacillus sp. YH-ame10]